VKAVTVTENVVLANIVGSLGEIVRERIGVGVGFCCIEDLPPPQPFRNKAK
jgi:hypothetical protein